MLEILFSRRARERRSERCLPGHRAQIPAVKLVSHLTTNPILVAKALLDVVRVSSEYTHVCRCIGVALGERASPGYVCIIL
jgi:hypothetical protein